MPNISFTSNLQRHLDVPDMATSGATVREVLARVFVQNPRLKSYLLDDQDCLRQHVVIFVDGRQVRDRTGLSDAVRPTSEIYVLQALSGG